MFGGIILARCKIMECLNCANNINVIEILTFLVALAAAVIAWFCFRRDHKRSRRELSVDLIFKWTTNLDKRASLARKYVEQLDEKQTRCLENQEEVRFNPSDKELCYNIKKLLNTNIKQPNTKSRCKCEFRDSKNLFLTVEESSELRWLIVNYLNILESVLVAWQHRIADDSIIEQELKYLFDLANGKDILKKYRIAAGSENSYPAIEVFYNHLEKKRRKNLKRKWRT